MKKMVFIIIAAAMIFSGCDKADEIIQKAKNMIQKGDVVRQDVKAVNVPKVKSEPVSKKKATVAPAVVKQSKEEDDDGEYSIAYINDYEGECEIKRKGKEIGEAISEIYLPLYQGDTLITEDSSSIEVVFDDATILKIDSNSRLVIQSLDRNAAKKTIVELIKGRIMAVVKKLTEEETFAVKTKMAMAAVKGTEFIVEADDDDKVGVFEGSVEVSGLDMDGNVMHRIILDKDKETVIAKRLRKPEKPRRLSRNFVKRYNEIEDIREKIKYVREMRRSGKAREYKLKRRLERIERLKRMRSNPEFRKKMTNKDKALMNEMMKREEIYKARLENIQKKNTRTKRLVKQLKSKKSEAQATPTEED